MLPEGSDAVGPGSMDAQEVDLKLENNFKVFEIDAVGGGDEEEIAAINDEDDDGMVRVTVDSGAAKSVWPRTRWTPPHSRLQSALTTRPSALANFGRAALRLPGPRVA